MAYWRDILAKGTIKIVLKIYADVLEKRKTDPSFGRLAFERRGSARRRTMAPKGMFNTTLAIPVSPIKAKQERLLGKLNRMMGEGKEEEEAKSGRAMQRRRTSWENIPIFIGGQVKATPGEMGIKEEESADSSSNSTEHL